MVCINDTPHLNLGYKNKLTQSILSPLYTHDSVFGNHSKMFCLVLLRRVKLTETNLLSKSTEKPWQMGQVTPQF